MLTDRHFAQAPPPLSVLEITEGVGLEEQVGGRAETYLGVEVPWAAVDRGLRRCCNGQRDGAAGASRTGAAMFIWLRGSSAVYLY